MKNLQLSILDQSPVRKRGNAHQAIHETIQLAKHADQLGYTRFWVSEHHNSLGLAGSTPEVLIAHLAGETERIRVGSGGIMMPNHSALKVAENFRMLETLFPGRIDLGMGRAPGTDRATASILNPSNTFSEQDFLQQLTDLRNFLEDEFEPGYDQSKIYAIPIADTVPALWLLSSSGQSGIFAAHFGMAFSFAHFINPIGGPQMVQMYKDLFRPSQYLKAPKANVAVFVLCAETEAKALQLQEAMDVQMILLEKKMARGFLPYEEIKGYQFTPTEHERVEFNRQRMIWGTPDKVKTQIDRMAENYGVDEVVIVTITHDFADRIRSYELLAEAFNLATIAEKVNF